MKKMTITIKINNPDVSKDIQVSIFESLEELFNNINEEDCLALINADIIRRARHNEREKMVTELYRKPR